MIFPSSEGRGLGEKNGRKREAAGKCSHQAETDLGKPQRQGLLAVHWGLGKPRVVCSFRRWRCPSRSSDQIELKVRGSCGEINVYRGTEVMGPIVSSCGGRGEVRREAAAGGGLLTTSQVEREEGTEGSCLVLGLKGEPSSAPVPQCCQHWALVSGPSFVSPSLRPAGSARRDPAVPRLGGCEQDLVLAPGHLG